MRQVLKMEYRTEACALMLQKLMSKYQVFSGPYFSAFGLITESIQSEYRKIRIRKNSAFGHFSPSDNPGKVPSQEQNEMMKLQNDAKIDDVKIDE